MGRERCWGQEGLGSSVPRESLRVSLLILQWFEGLPLDGQPLFSHGACRTGVFLSLQKISHGICVEISLW